MTRRGRILVLAVATVLALGVAALVSAKSYSPLQITAIGPGPGVSPKLTMSGDTVVLHIDGEKQRTAEVRVVVHNPGRWGLTIDGTPRPYPCSSETPKDPEGTGGCAQIVALRQTPRAVSTGEFLAVHVPAHSSVSLWARISGRCWHSKSDPGAGNGVAISFSGVEVHYSYLGVFGRTAIVDSPLGFEFAC